MTTGTKRNKLRKFAQRIVAKAQHGKPQTTTHDTPVRVEFEGHPEIMVPPGSTVLQVAIRSKIELSHFCGGNCSCGSCRIRVLEGIENLSRPQGREEMVLGHGRVQKGERLGCQSRILGPVRVTIPDGFMGD